MKNESEKKMKILSKVICIISKINLVLVSIAATGVIILMVASPFIIKNIEVNDKSVTIYEHTYKYEITESNVTIDGKVITDKEFNIVDTFKNHSDFELILSSESILIFALVSLVFVYLVFRKVIALFKNIYKGNTPFTEENVKHIKNIAKYMLIAAILMGVSGVIIETLTNHSFDFNTGFIGTLSILILYAFSYIFEYGYNLQKEIDTTL